MRDKFERLLPRYTYLPLAMLGIMLFFVYYATKFMAAGLEHHVLSTRIDSLVPFVPAFIIVYVLAYVQWICGYVIIARESRETCYRVVSAELIAKVICLIVFLVYPTTMKRAAVDPANGFFDWATAMIYRLDEPTNLLPSIHCLESWLCFRGAIGAKRVPKWYQPVNLVFTLAVFASTVLVKQHVLIDIPAGILVAEIGLAVSRLLKTGRFFAFLEKKFLKTKPEPTENSVPARSLHE